MPARLTLALAGLAIRAGACIAGDAAPLAYHVVDGVAIPEPLGATAGDAGRGAALAGRKCAQCHALPDTPPPDVVHFGPPLAGVGARHDAGWLRLAVVNLAIRAPAVEGHAFYDVPAYDAVSDAPVETLLGAQDVEDIVAWLASLAR